MKRLYFAACGILAVGTFVAGPVWASCNSPNPFPANNGTICANNYGGEFSQPTGPSGENICDVISGGQLVLEAVAPGCNEASFNAGFQAEYSVFNLTRYTRDGGSCSTTTVSDSELVGCYNSQGNPTDLDPCICPTDDRGE